MVRQIGLRTTKYLFAKWTTSKIYNDTKATNHLVRCTTILKQHRRYLFLKKCDTTVVFVNFFQNVVKEHEKHWASSQECSEERLSVCINILSLRWKKLKSERYIFPKISGKIDRTLFIERVLKIQWIMAERE